MIKAVLFDFDDTLCLTEEACWHLENEIAVQMGYQPMSRELHKQTWGKPLGDIIATRIPGIDIGEFMQRISVYQPLLAAEGKIDTITSDNLVVLDSLKAHGKKLGVLTSRELKEAAHLLDADHPLTTRIDVFYHKDNVDYIKPDPRVFDHALKDFGVLPSEMVYVGDAVTDAQAAKNAGLHFIALLESGIRHKEDFAQETVDLFVNSLPEIVEYVLSN